MGIGGDIRDVDLDAIPYRTVPGNQHPSAAYFARGTGHTPEAQYSEDPEVWHDNLERLKRKYETARHYMPEPAIELSPGAEIGIISFGSTESAIAEARHLVAEADIATDFLRLRAVPFTDDVEEFIRDHRVCTLWR